VKSSLVVVHPIRLDGLREIGPKTFHLRPVAAMRF
jgi:hypothetical protein